MHWRLNALDSRMLYTTQNTDCQCDITIITATITRTYYIHGKQSIYQSHLIEFMVYNNTKHFTVNITAKHTLI